MASVVPKCSHCTFQLLCVLVGLLFATTSAYHDPDVELGKRQAPAAQPLVTFQVSEPVLVPTGDSNQYGCVRTQLLMDYVFAFSYGKPFVGSYTPPPCSFNRVTINFTVTSRGVQFDRLGLMYLGDVEVFRTSTAEPTRNGIVWTYIKEMEQYNALWKTDQKIIFDLGNLIDDRYTGTFNTTLTATFSTVPTSRMAADQILPISARRSAENGPSAFSVPGDDASVAYQIPQNVEKAVVSLSACGQGGEEFWYTNVLDSDVAAFENETGTLYGKSPFREVQLLIDGQLAGVSWPFPIIFTGGIVPGLWRPIVGIDAFDLREHEIDVTPWLPLLCDGASHTFEIRVAGLNDDGRNQASLSETVGSSWIVTGKIFLFLGPEGSTTSGTGPRIDTAPPSIQINSIISNDTLITTTAVTRSISITSEIKTSNGTTFAASWTQDLDYSNLDILSDYGSTQYVQQRTSGTDRSSTSRGRYENKYSYPLTVNSTFTSSDTAVEITATLSRGLDFSIIGPSIFPSGTQSFNRTSAPALFALAGHQQQQQQSLIPYTAAPLPALAGSQLSTTQSGSAAYRSGSGNTSYSFGMTGQGFVFGGVETDAAGTNLELYTRAVQAVNASVVRDEEVFVRRKVASPLAGVAVGEGAVVDVQGGEGRSVRSLLGRGPGRAKDVLVSAGGRDIA
ncbi:MAG: hypothetical protein Q9219_005105 [cf. Caloplaca sp. 3 TL-2023]